MSQQEHAYSDQVRYPQCAAHYALLAEVHHRTANQFAMLTIYIHLSLEISKEPR